MTAMMILALGSAACAAPLTPPQFDHGGLKLLVATIDGEHLYCVRQLRISHWDKKVKDYFSFHLLQLPMTELDNSPRKTKVYDASCEFERGFHWRITGGVFWKNLPSADSRQVTHIPLEDLDMYPQTELGIVPVHEKFVKKYKNNRNIHDWMIPQPVCDCLPIFGHGVTGLSAWYSILPLSANDALLFLRRQTDPKNPLMDKADLLEVYFVKGKWLDESHFKGQQGGQWDHQYRVRAS